MFDKETTIQVPKIKKEKITKKFIKNLSSVKLTEKKKLPPFTKKVAAGCGILAGLFIVIIIVIAIIFGSGTPTFDKVKSPTNQSPVTLSAHSAYKNAKIELYQNGTKAQELTSDNNGKFTVQAELKEGDNKFKATATNDKGKSKTSLEINIVYDKTPPPISLIQPQSPTENERIEIQGESEENAEIKLLKEGKEVAKLNTKDVKFTFKDVALIEGENNFKAIVIDVAGNHSESREITVSLVSKKSDLDINKDDTAEIYSLKDVKANEKNFSASVYMSTVTKESVIKTVKDIKDSNYTSMLYSFEIFIFDNEEIAKKYLRVTNEESMAFDHEMKAWYVKINDPKHETLEILGEYQDIEKLDL